MAANENQNAEGQNQNSTPDPRAPRKEPAPLPAVLAEKLIVSKGQQDAQTALALVEKKDPRVNAFSAIALMLKNMRTDLEGIHRTPQPPRWVRIARVREFNKKGAMNFIARDGVVPITGFFIMLIGIFAELTMKAQEILTQADGGRAWLEVGYGTIKTAASDEFHKSIQRSLGNKTPGTNPLQGIVGPLDLAMNLIDKIPDPEDVKVVAEQLYLLLCVDQLELPLGSDGKVDTDKLPPPETTLHIKDTTGKIRLLSWALEKPISFHGLTSSDGEPVSELGSRRVWEAKEGVPSEASFILKQGDVSIDVYKFNYNPGKDIEEANKLLKNLNYPDPKVENKTVFTADFARRLRQFQKINKLPVNGQLDNHTINQLMNLDYENSTLRRAKPYSKDPLSKPFDDTKNEPVKEKKPKPEIK